MTFEYLNFGFFFESKKQPIWLKGKPTLDIGFGFSFVWLKQPTRKILIVDFTKTNN